MSSPDFTYESYFYVGDIDNDGKVDILIIYQDYSIDAIRLEVINQDGYVKMSLKTKLNSSLFNGNEYYTNANKELPGIGVFDINSDSNKELIIPTPRGEVICYDPARNETIWTTDLHGAPVYGITTGDVDGDGIQEILIPTMSGGFYIYHYDKGLAERVLVSFPGQILSTPSTYNGKILFTENDNGNLMIYDYRKREMRMIPYGFSGISGASAQHIIPPVRKLRNGVTATIMPDPPYYALINVNNGKVIWWRKIDISEAFSASIVDMDLDGVEEVVITGTSEVSYSTDIGSIYVLSSVGGEVEWAANMTGRPLNIALTDVNGDGVLDVIVSTVHKGFIYCFNGVNGELLWSVSETKSVFPIAIGDVDGDGKPDIVYSGGYGEYFDEFYWFISNSSESYIGVIDATTGEEKYRISFNAPVLAPIIYDVNGDGIEEIIALAMNGNFSIIERDRVIYSDREKAAIMAAPAIGNIDNDQEKEIIIARSSIEIYKLNTSKKGGWPQIGFSSEHLFYRDSDGDWIEDYQEKHYGLDPLKNDTDGDGINDYDEIVPKKNNFQPWIYLLSIILIAIPATTLLIIKRSKRKRKQI